jgi:FkbM family methyltransferase
MIKAMIQKSYHLIKVMASFYKLELDKDLKSRIKSTLLRVFILRRYDSKNKTANIAGFKTRFIDFWEFRFLFKEIFLNNEYYFTAENADPFIIDCGSNIGMSVLYFKMLYPNSRIIAFEPGQETFSCLADNVKNNQLDSVTLHKAVVSNKEGLTDFYVSPDNTNSLIMSTKLGRMLNQKQTVQATILSKYIDQEVDFLKMDIEGAELEVIEELSKTKKLSLIKYMVIEYHHHIEKDSDVLSKMLILLESAGFGYQINSHTPKPHISRQFQDIMIYAYQKKSTF